MALSKPIFDLLTSYLMQLYSNPIRTKAISSFVIATSGNLTSQYISGQKFNEDSLIAYSMFGLLFGGTIPHFFYTLLDRLFSSKDQLGVFKKLIFERLIYAPLYIAFSLYMIARFEKKSHKTAVKQVSSLHWSLLMASWKWLTIVHVINFSLVPPMLRVLVANLVGFFWTIFLSLKRAKHENKEKN